MAGPGTASWVPLVNISRHMETALLVCEDGRFWRHRGFDREAIANSIRDNLRADRFLRGASTISMQLAKNLYLKREKTVSRKLQEVVLTLLLEQELTKGEILELYLNVIEYGPGVYGIGDAAEHYFRTDPSELSLSQAFYLASILPNPRANHFRADGRLSDGWTRYLHRLLSIAHERGRVSDDELQSALSEQLMRGRPSPNDSFDSEAADEPPVDPLEQRP
jgi:membrane peptidoglycan carboxypeptidase